MAAEDSGKTQWHELYHEVVETNLCTGCAACVMACPRDVLEYDHSQTYHPFNVELSTAADDCSHGQRGCDICTRACPRFRDWEVESDQALFGRPRETEEVCGIERGVYLVRAADPEVLERGQDGGLVSALLIWGLETGRIEGALTSRLSRTRGCGRSSPRSTASRWRTSQRSTSRGSSRFGGAPRARRSTSRSRRCRTSPARAASCARTLRPSTPTSPPVDWVRPKAGRSRWCAPSAVRSGSKAPLRRD